MAVIPSYWYQVMRKQLLVLATSLAVAVAATSSFAEDQKSGPHLYRYKNDKGVMVIESAIPPEYATKGYQILTRGGQVLETIAPATNVVADPEEARRLREQNAQMGRKDADLRKLYSSPQDAERLRDRQMESISLKIDYAKGQMSQLASKRKAELEQAARLERKGTAVPADMRANIDRMSKQLADQDAQMKALEADREKLRTDFEPIIERLKVIYPNKVAPVAAPAASAAPAAAPVAAPPAASAPAAPKR